MKSWERGFSASVEREGKTGFRVRYRCPWCDENSNVAAPYGVPLVDHGVAFVVVCEANPCRRPSLLMARIFERSMIGERISVDELHPNPRESYAPDGVPENIAADFEEALNCRAAGYNLAAAVVGRRVLQAALVDRGAAARADLVDQINALPDATLSQQVKVAAQHVRLIGNDAAHTRAVSADDVTSLVGFVELVLQQLYILPHQIARQTRTIQPRHMPGAQQTGGWRRGGTEIQPAAAVARATPSSTPATAPAPAAPPNPRADGADSGDG